jgi:hypothetical protein
MSVLAGDVVVHDEVRHDDERLVTVVMRRGPRPLDQHSDRARTDALQPHNSSNFRHRSLTSKRATIRTGFASALCFPCSL